jgi:glycosyltransferase involved in cell wall biosynthesis
LRVGVLIHEFGRSGGAQTVLRYARALEDAELLVTAPRARDLPAEVDGVPVRHVSEAGGRRYDCAIATWWTTAESLWEVEADRRLVFLQSIEQRFYEEHHWYERFAAEEVLALPVGYVVVAPWMRDLLAELRPDAPCVVVRNGIDKEMFRPRGGGGDRADGPLRVLVEGQPTMWFKGVRESLAAVRAMREPVEATLVAGDPDSAGGVDGVRVVGGLDPAGMAEVYAAHDVVLKLSRVESLGLGPIEGFHVGLPAVVTPYTGHEEYLDHDRNGLVVGFDDVPGTARALDSLAADRGRLRRLAEGALATAASWPAADAAASAFEDAIRELCGGPPPDADGALTQLQRAQRRWLELSREHARQELTVAEGLRGSVRWYEHALAEAAEHHRELDRQRHEVSERASVFEAELARRTEQLEELKATRAYRAAAALRRLKPGRDA